MSDDYVSQPLLIPLLSKANPNVDDVSARKKIGKCLPDNDDDEDDDDDDDDDDEDVENDDDKYAKAAALEEE